MKTIYNVNVRKKQKSSIPNISHDINNINIGANAPISRANG